VCVELMLFVQTISVRVHVNDIISEIWNRARELRCKLAMGHLGRNLDARPLARPPAANDPTDGPTDGLEIPCRPRPGRALHARV